MARTKKYPCIITKFQGINVATFAMKVKDAVFIHYVAARGVSDEEGAVQRLLVTRRVNSIRDFVKQGNGFFNTFILNWTDQEFKPSISRGTREIQIPLVARAAQVIDGQHRLAGLERAMTDDPAVGETEILVSLTLNLTTAEAAKIFLNINTEQKPVPKSLIYDLFGEVDADPNHLINRANDIASELADNTDSPYYSLIKFPGAVRGGGAIDLSTVVSSLKPHLSNGGAFSKYNLNSLQYQKTVLLNFFLSIKSFYDDQGLWENKAKNPFLRAAGFAGAVDFMTESLLGKCAEVKNFSVEKMCEFIRLDKSGLLLMEDVRQLDGKTARRTIKDHLEAYLRDQTPNQEEYEF
ncbi:DGQHR domain-containing protein [Burkholderia ubonensis]|uniref:DGQHR domain-containing protein n=1 Tax=Burkholderia ubonensis TaxID=101571 RepID=UPI000B4E7D56|nr:DGQHR domain-containing protein [Burkholderia ubonensis]